MSAGAAVRQVPAHSRPMQDVVVYFEYLGHTGLTVQGPSTGKRYRFDGHGAKVAVDIRDKRSLAGVPRLRQVSGLS
jgi:hypothetical protein